MTALYETHPAADLFPLMEGNALDALSNDIKEHGQSDPIVLLDGKILDGRNRYRACQRIGVTPATTEWTGCGGTPEAFVISKNLHRRHLNESQRALIAAKLATLKPGNVATQRNSGGQNYSPEPISLQAAADMLNVSRGSTVTAKRVLAKAEPEEIQLVERGEVAVATIAKSIQTSASPKQRAAERTAPPKKQERPTQRQNAELWNALSGALRAINGLPDPADVARSVRAYKRHMDIAQQTEKATLWLMQFEEAWQQCSK